MIDDFKARFVSEHFKGKKIALFYKFKAELEAISTYLDVTDNLDEFNSSNKSIALQIVSGRGGFELVQS